MSETPLYDELEDKWNETFNRRNICDSWWTVYHLQSGQEWFEDDEGNEVFPEPQYAYLVPQEVKVGDTVTPIKVGETLPLGLKPKFKLFGRNQRTD